MSWISIPKYAKIKGLKSPQVVYNWIDKGKIEKGKWRMVEKTIKRKEIFLEK